MPLLLLGAIAHQLIGLRHRVPETGFLRESMGLGEVFSSKNPVSLVRRDRPQA
ncbi:hypothetical protein [Phormidium nigroviride]